MRVALLEDDLSHSELVEYWLKLGGHDAQVFARAGELLNAMEQQEFDALVLDWNVGDLSGIEVLLHVREHMNSNIPVLFSTARDSEHDIVTALRGGADDCVVKPIRREEFLARLSAIALENRGAQKLYPLLKIGRICVDRSGRRISRDGIPVSLTIKDFDLAVVFLTSIGRFFSRRQLLRHVWGTDALASSRTLDTHVNRVRTKLKLTQDEGWDLRATYGQGYRLVRVTPGSPST
jgi:two-component system, OmpR family, response regulator RegX3